MSCEISFTMSGYTMKAFWSLKCLLGRFVHVCQLIVDILVHRDLLLVHKFTQYEIGGSLNLIKKSFFANPETLTNKMLYEW